ncbi:hypothetical protein ACLQ26_12725 [Micromonospora sp. DT43]|uniref:hypothetical protein n=1 Tax=Micromonospora sp. DT43 TaxID=3393440 RepID=UPI003CF4B9EA
MSPQSRRRRRARASRSGQQIVRQASPAGVNYCDPAGELILYRSDDGGSVVQLRASKGTIWLTQAQMAELYGTSVLNIVQIMRRVLADEEVTEATINSELSSSRRGW